MSILYSAVLCDLLSPLLYCCAASVSSYEYVAPHRLFIGLFQLRRGPLFLSSRY